MNEGFFAGLGIGGELPWRLYLGGEPWGAFTSEADAVLFRDAMPKV